MCFWKSLCCWVDWLKSNAIEVTYNNVQSTVKGSAKGSYEVSSLTMHHYFLYAGANCHSYDDLEDLTSCQTLANLCVLQHYDLTSTVIIGLYNTWTDKDKEEGEMGQPHTRL